MNASIGPMLTEAQVSRAVANGIKFLNRTREPYGLWFMSMMHRLFGIPEFADALKRYDEETAARPQEAPVLRVLRRLNDANNPLNPDDWDHVLIHTDRILATALYCDRLGFPPAYAEVLERGMRAGGYHATHVLLAWIWMRANRGKVAVRAGFVEDLYRANAAILEDRPTIVNDLKLEAAAFLCMARQGKRVDPRFIRHVVSILESGRRLGKTGHSGPGQPGPVLLALDDPGSVALAARALPRRTERPASNSRFRALGRGIKRALGDREIRRTQLRRFSFLAADRLTIASCVIRGVTPRSEA